MITAQASAKIHLIGEYSAIWGKPAIIFPIDLKLSTEVQKSKTETKKESFQKAIETKIETLFQKKVPAYSLKIDSQIPTGSGLGSSAALSASLTLALLKLINIKAPRQKVFEIAIEGEKVFHGFPSGSDLWTVILKKPIWFRKETADLMTVTPLDFKIPQLFLINSGKPYESTKQMVDFVTKNVSKATQEQFANNQEELTKQMFYALKNSGQITNIIRGAHKNLAKLGVVSKGAGRIIKEVENLGGAAKITGAGGRKEGSGMIIAFHKQPKKLKSLGYKLIKIK